ncbi:hypothetical protein [Arenibacterium sp. LLYu02]|uniref:hypothetical protein n=1 Tax=Arenibacterium sp. LLYu02 TaxID=3404132 RepID=UPI003B21D15D
MWATGFLGIRIGIIAYCLPFVWVYNPALLMDGTWGEVVLVVTTFLVGAFVLKQSMMITPFAWLPEWLYAFLLALLGLFVMGATVLFGPLGPGALAVALGAAALVMLLERMRKADPFLQPERPAHDPN